MLYRKCQKAIEKWIAEGSNAMLVTGARQVGKTFLIREILKASSYDYVEINLIRNPEYISLFNKTLQSDCLKLVEQFSVIANKPLRKKETIIFIDEVQECKEIMTSLKFLVEEGSYKYIISGSLLGVELNNLRSAPVGFLSILEMFPLDLEEFLIANGLHPSFIDQLYTCYKEHVPVDEILHKKLIDAFYRYLIVGGMPQAVCKYLDTNDLISTSEIHRDIHSLYMQDFTKYESESRARLHLIDTYNVIPAELNTQNKRYILKHIDSNIKFARYENSVNWLIDAGVVLPVFNITEPLIPLEINSKRSLFKLFMSDVGMLTSEYGQATILKLLNQDNDINCGAIFENFVAQELRAHGYKGYYYNSKKFGKLDFVIEHLGQVLPLEVKSGKDYTTHSALTNVMKSPNYNISNAYVLSDKNISVKDDVIYLPIYMTMFISEDSLVIENPPRLDFNL